MKTATRRTLNTNARNRAVTDAERTLAGWEAELANAQTARATAKDGIAANDAALRVELASIEIGNARAKLAIAQARQVMR